MMARTRSSAAMVWSALLGVIAAAAIVARVEASAETVKFFVPGPVAFAVTNVGNRTVGSPNPSTVSFSQLATSGANVLRISIKADSDFVPPGGTAIPAAKVSWTTSNASNGVASNGTLSAAAYTQVYQSNATKKAGGVDVTWTLAAPGTGIRAGAHQLTLRWKLESVMP